MNRQIFNEIGSLKRRLLPNEKVILFGSQARGDACADSDWDLLILLNKKERDFIRDYDRYGYPFAEIGLKYDAVISVKIFTVKDWESHPYSLFNKNVEREGIEIL